MKSWAKLFYSLMPNHCCLQLLSSFSTICCLSYLLDGKVFQPWSWTLRLTENYTLIARNDLRNNPVILYTMKWDPKRSRDLLRSLGSYRLSWNRSPQTQCSDQIPSDPSEQKFLYPFNAEDFLHFNAEHSCIYGKLI